jgi:SRSO17 transposase
MELWQEQGAFPEDVPLNTIRPWALGQTEVERRRGPQFARREVRWRAWAYIRGLLSPIERKNGWQLAAVHGAPPPYGVQPLLGRALWDAEALRNDWRPYMVEHLGAPQAVLVVDETGFVKKGQQSAGVARQDSGTAGRVDNCPLGVFVTYASPQGHLWLDRALYLPNEWPSDKARGEAAGIPEARPFAPKPQWAQQRLKRAFDAGVPAAGGTGDSVYGENRSLRLWLAEHHRAHVMAVSGKAYVWHAGRHHQVKTLLAALGAEGWSRLRAGAGSQGPRWYDWCWQPLARPRLSVWRRWLLGRRRVSAPTELTAYVVCAPAAPALATVVQVAGSRGTVERCFEEAKGEVGLDHYEVRSWTGWSRHITLALWADAVLTGLRAAHLPTTLPLKKMTQGSTQSRVTAFKVSRGLGCRSVGARCVASFGVLCWPPSSAWSVFWRGPRGAAGTKGSPKIGMTNDAQFHNYNCSTRHQARRKSAPYGSPGTAGW